jgi:hypothetical protein
MGSVYSGFLSRSFSLCRLGCPPRTASSSWPREGRRYRAGLLLGKRRLGVTERAAAEPFTSRLRLTGKASAQRPTRADCCGTYTVPSRQNPVPSQPQVIDLFGSPGRIRTSDQPVNSRSASLPTLDLKLDAISVARGNQSRGSAGRRALALSRHPRSGLAALRVPAASHVKISSRLPAVSFSWSDEPVALPPGSRQTCDQTVANRVAWRSYNPNDCALGIGGATWYRPG